MTSTNLPTVDPSDLCITCGLCCNGTLFDYADLKEHEFEQVVRLGMKPADDTNKTGFSLPCPQLDGTKCSCYGDRPSVCGDFMCELVDTLTTGEMSLDETQHVVARTKEISNELRAQLRAATGGGPELSIYQLTVQLADVSKLSGDERAFRREHAAMYLGLASLHLTLSTHFMPEDAEGGRALWSLPS